LSFQLLTFFSKKFKHSTPCDFNDIRGKLKKIKKVKNKNVFSPTLVITLILSILIFSTYFEESNAQSVESVQENTDSTVIIENFEDRNGARPYWRLEEGQTLYVNIVNSGIVSEKKIDVIKNAILSQEVVRIQKSHSLNGGEEVLVYHVGWLGALNMASEESTQFIIPKNLEIIESRSGEGQILILLSEDRNSKGYTGYTWLESNDDQILKSIIKIYGVNDLTDRSLASITRHEFGHALGLNHSSLPGDLMFNVISTSFPYISDSHIVSLRTIYGVEDSGHTGLFSIPLYKQIVNVKISGMIEYERGTFVTVKITDPDGSVQEKYVKVSTDGLYSVFYHLNHDSVAGKYFVEVWYNQAVVDATSFSVIGKEQQKNEINGSKYASMVQNLDNGGWPQDVKWKRYHKINGAWEFVGYE